ncbi:MAG: nuclear transport factor 2 family protein [Terriglobales bacterium]
MNNRLAVSVLLSAILLLSACTMWREHPGSNKWKDATGGEGLERSFWKEVKDKNWNELERHIASNYMSISPEGGRLDKAGALVQLQQLQLNDYTLGDLQTELNSDTFVVTYTMAMRGTSAGQPLPSEPVRMMSVWQKQSAGWMAIAHSVLGPEKK